MWTDGYNILSKKHKIGTHETQDIEESNLMLSNSYFRIYDSGNIILNYFK